MLIRVAQKIFPCCSLFFMSPLSLYKKFCGYNRKKCTISAFSSSLYQRAGYYTTRKADQWSAFFVEEKRDRPQDRLSVFLLKTLLKSFLYAGHFPHQVKTRMKILVFIFYYSKVFTRIGNGTVLNSRFGLLAKNDYQSFFLRETFPAQGKDQDENLGLYFLL